MKIVFPCPSSTFHWIDRHFISDLHTGQLRSVVNRKRTVDVCCVYGCLILNEEIEQIQMPADWRTFIFDGSFRPDQLTGNPVNQRMKFFIEQLNISTLFTQIGNHGHISTQTGYIRWLREKFSSSCARKHTEMKRRATFIVLHVQQRRSHCIIVQ